MPSFSFFRRISNINSLGNGVSKSSNWKKSPSAFICQIVNLFAIVLSRDTQISFVSAHLPLTGNVHPPVSPYLYLISALILPRLSGIPSSIIFFHSDNSNLISMSPIGIPQLISYFINNRPMPNTKSTNTPMVIGRYAPIKCPYRDTRAIPKAIREMQIERTVRNTIKITLSQLFGLIVTLLVMSINHYRTELVCRSWELTLCSQNLGRQVPQCARLFLN